MSNSTVPSPQPTCQYCGKPVHAEGWIHSTCEPSAVRESAPGVSAPSPESSLRRALGAVADITLDDGTKCWCWEEFQRTAVHEGWCVAARKALEPVSGSPEW